MFSSPAPRATPRRAPGSRAPRTPSVLSTQETDHTPTPSIRSRLPYKAAHTPRAAYASQISPASSNTLPESRTVREQQVEGWDRVYWTRNERYGVTSAGTTPKEVRGISAGSGAEAQAQGVVDITSGYALVVTSEVIKAWNYAKRTNASPTCYTFPTLRSQSLSSGPNQASFFAHASSSEPGIIAIASSGEIRLWDNVGLGLTNPDRFHEDRLDLGDSDFVEGLFKINDNSFVVTSATSLAWRLVVTSSAGRPDVAITPFTKAGGMFSRVTPVIFSDKEDKTGIQAVIVRENELLLQAGRTLQKWSVSGSSQKLVQEYDLHDAIGSSLFESWSSNQVTLDLEDTAVYHGSQLATLFSYSEPQAGSSSRTRSERSFGIAIVDLSSKAGTLTVSWSIDISHSDESFGDTEKPRLYIPPGNSLAFVRYASEIIVVSLSSTVPYESVISLKGTNTFLGAGCHKRDGSSGAAAGPSLVLFPAIGGLMNVEIYEVSPRFETVSPMAAATAQLKSTIEQAVFYGDRSQNPLTFHLSPHSSGSYAEAAESVSEEIIASSSKYMPGIFELRAQLLDRASRLRGLIDFIRDNGLLNLLPQSTRRSLQRDAEKMQGAIDLWDHQNKLMDNATTGSPQALLSRSIATYMSSIGIQHDDDLVRLFFRTQVQHLDALLEVVFNTFQAEIREQTREDTTGWVMEANTIFLRVLRAAARLREDDLGKYEVDREHPTDELWTSQESLISAMEELYSITERLIQDRTSERGTVIDEPPTEIGDKVLRHQQINQKILKDQLANLAASLCINMEDRVRYAYSWSAEEGGGDAMGVELGERWTEMRPRLIRPLVDIDRIANAYELAEHHRDWETLVWLLHHNTAGRGEVETQRYIELYGEEFAFVLYNWYIQNNHGDLLLRQDEVYGLLVTRFFDSHDHPELAWMHHIASKRFEQAAVALKQVDRQTGNLEDKLLIGSIGKLAAVVDIKTKGDSGARKKLLIELDDELDLVNVQRQLRQSIITSVPSRRATPPSMQVFAEQNATLLYNRPAFYSQFVEFSNQLVNQEEALDIEALVDVLTMKDNLDSCAGDPATALERLYNDTELPDGRKQVALLSIWRRIYIRDDWAEIANTSGRSEEAQRQLLRETLAYQTFSALQDQRDTPRDFRLTPSVASQPPLAAEVSARFPSLLADELEAVMADHTTEISILTDYIDKSGLEARVREIEELLKRDQQQQERSGDWDITM